MFHFVIRVSKLLAVMSVFISFNAGALEPMPDYNWSAGLSNPPPLGNGTKGSQVFHFKTANKPHVISAEARKFAQQHFKNAAEVKSDAEALRFASDSVTIKGAYIELGVCTGRTINLIAALNPHVTVHGFDSFEGLPEPWVRKDFIMAKDTFAFKEPSSVPPVLDNVALYKGLFKDVLPKFVEENLKNEPIALLHLDSDIYSSTKEALDSFRKNIIPGTIIIFDEYYNYSGFEQHEYKAFTEFLAENNLGADYIAYNGWHEQVVARIK